MHYEFEVYWKCSYSDDIHKNRIQKHICKIKLVILFFLLMFYSNPAWLRHNTTLPGKREREMQLAFCLGWETVKWMRNSMNSDKHTHTATCFCLYLCIWLITKISTMGPVFGKIVFLKMWYCSLQPWQEEICSRLCERYWTKQHCYSLCLFES